MGFNFLIATLPLDTDSFFTTKSPGGPDTHLIDLGTMKDRVNLGATLILNPESLDWESSALTTRPLFPRKCLCNIVVVFRVNKNNPYPTKLGFEQREVWLNNIDHSIDP